MTLMSLKNLDHRVCLTKLRELMIKRKGMTTFQMLSGNTFSRGISQARFKATSRVSRNTSTNNSSKERNWKKICIREDLLRLRISSWRSVIWVMVAGHTTTSLIRSKLVNIEALKWCLASTTMLVQIFGRLHAWFLNLLLGTSFSILERAKMKLMARLMII